MAVAAICSIAPQALGLSTPEGDRTDTISASRPNIIAWDNESQIDPSVGGVFCDYMAKKTWGSYFKTLDPVQTLRQNGFRWVRVGVVTTSNADLRDTPPEQWNTLPWNGEYWSCREYAEQIMQEAADANMHLNLFFFLSYTAAHAGQQYVPPEWDGLTIEQTCDVLRDYCYQTTKYFKDKGLNIEVYDIGNEIERGILGFRPGERIPLPPGVDITTDMNYMRENIWFPEAELMKSAIAGVRAADDEAKIVLHIAGLGISPDNLFVKTFFYTMIERDVDFDYAGLSYPYRDYHPTEKPYFLSKEFRDTIAYLTSLKKKVIISEFGYPNSPIGIDGDPDPGYPYTPTGQATWVKDFLAACFEENHIERAFYFYPEYFPGLSYGSAISLESSGLLADDTHLQPAAYEFRAWSTSAWLSITKCTVTAGRKVSSDAISFSGTMDATADDFNDANVVITIDSNDMVSPCIQTFPINNKTWKVTKGKYGYSGTEDGVKKSFKYDVKTGKFSFAASKLDLCSLACPLTVQIEINSYVGTAEVGENVVNGPRKPIPTKLTDCR